MTNNIVAQFSCSLDTNGNFKEYRVVSGSVFNEEYNETLDSGTIVLSQVSKEDRLTNIKAYDYIRVYDKSGNTGFDKLFLVDNFDEKENNIKEHIYGYTINIMSETKYLEKIQCPNLVITHEIKNGVVKKKTIYEHIRRYMELFVPKIKYCEDGENWKYEPLIKMPGENDTEIHQGSMVINYTASDFEYFSGHGANWYIFSFLTNSLDPDEVDFDTVDNYSVTLNDENVDWISNEIYIWFDTNEGTFRLEGDSRDANSGSMTIHYTYRRPATNTFGAFYKRFNVPCADLSFNCPTLRQLLTTLMQQVGCIPIVRNRTLGFLDFQKEAVDFGDGDYSVGNTVNFIRRSLSSDSYVNTLVNISDNVLDSENEVICETLGFRDSNNVLLKQKENLKLETSFPIYKVNKCILHGPGRLNGYLGSSYGMVLATNTGPYVWPSVYYKEIKIANGSASIKFCIDRAGTIGGRVKLGNIYFLSRDATTGVYRIEATERVDDFYLDISTTTNDDIEYIYQGQLQTMAVKSKVLTFSVPSNVVGCLFSGTYTNTLNNNTRNFTIFRFDNADPNVTYHDMTNSSVWFSDTSWNSSGTINAQNAYYNAFTARFNLSGIVGFQTWDISKLVVENSVRQLLDRDFQKMTTQINSAYTASLDDLAQYVYGTVGYSIGSKTISGFSDVFVEGEDSALGWVQKGYTYIENIVNVLEKNSSLPQTEVIFEFFEGLGNDDIYKEVYPTNDPTSMLPYSLGNLIDYSFVYYNAGKNNFDSVEATFYTGFFVDLYYQPLNSFNLSYVKKDEDVPIPLAQYDGNASGLTDFDRLSIHEQEQVDRIGNETLFISQRTNDFDDIQTFDNGPLSFRDSAIRGANADIDYIIFKRSFTIGNNCFNVSYVGSKDSVLKDYFTSIRTKYRAYQYVDYNASVLRKEKDVFYIRVSNDYYNADDRVLLKDLTTQTNFMYSLTNYANPDERPYKISYEVETNDAKVANGTSGYTVEKQTVKNSVSVISTNNTMAFIYEYVDNVGAGTYIKDLTDDANLGGIPQSWQIWSDNYNLRHEVSYTNFIDFYSQTLTLTSTGDDSPENVVRRQLANIERSPIVDDSYDYTTIFSIVDNNASNNKKRTFYKDYAERINHTVQFIYYAPNKDVLFAEDFIAGTPMINRFADDRDIAIYSSTLFSIDGNEHDVPDTDTLLPDSNVQNYYFQIITNTIDGVPYLRVYWQNKNIIKLCYKNSNTGKVRDIAVFKKIRDEAYTNFYFTINDTKTDKVFSEKNGILYIRYNVTTYTQHAITGDSIYPRKVIPLYDEED